MSKVVSSRPGQHDGFVLLEVVIVVGIMSILAALALVNYTNAKYRAELALAQSGIRNVADAVELYFLAEQKYPAVADGGWKDALKSGGFMNVIPNDPAGDPFRYCSNTVGFHLETQNAFGETPPRWVYMNERDKVVTVAFDPPNVFAECDW